MSDWISGKLLGRTIIGMFALLPLVASAGDGVVELNQVCATQTGCANGDTPGFPITLNARGSYRLTSNLVVPNQNTNGIEISSADITVDFGGFTMLGPNTVTVPGLVCSQGGTGVGIRSTGPAGAFVAMNGRIRGMGSDGIVLPSASTVRMERFIVEENCGDGIELGSAAVVSQVQVRANHGFGINVSFGGIIRDSIAEWNRSIGIYGNANSVLVNNVASSNGHVGISLVPIGATGGLVVGNSASGNGWQTGSIGSGIAVSSGASALLNNVAGSAGSGISASDPNSTVGLNTTSANTGLGIDGGIAIGCNTVNGVRVCP